MSSHYLIAFRLDNGPSTDLVAAPGARPWMDASSDKFAYRCLPLLIANQAGWLVLNSCEIRAVWTGEDPISSLTIEYPKGKQRFAAVSHFGHGIITWSLPYLFRTPPGYNLLVRGPANSPKDGVSPLEGIVETDWTNTTFTMNWKITRSNYPVTFDVNEPICMIVPQRRGELESFKPQIRHMKNDSEVETGFKEWSKSRETFLRELRVPGTEASKKAWQRDYFHGKSLGGDHSLEHQTRLNLREFEEHKD